METVRPPHSIVHSVRTLLATGVVAVGALVCQGGPGSSPFAFVDVSASAGIADVGLSFGVSVGDFDGDGWPDVFAGGHYASHPRLWLNRQDGTYVDVVAALVPPPTGDMHGAQWVDLDNDGTQELILLRGANYGFSLVPKHVYRWDNGRYIDVASSLGLDTPAMRARTPVAVDHDRDGQLDVFFTSLLRGDHQAPPTLFRQGGGAFQDVGALQPLLRSVGTEFGVLGDLDGDRVLDVLFDGMPTRAYAMGASGLTDITAAIGLPPLPTAHDFVLADLTGDGVNELYAARDTQRSSVRHSAPGVVEFRPFVGANEHGVRFAAPPGSVLWVDWVAPNLPPSSVYLGSQGLHPGFAGAGLDSLLPAHQGIVAHAAGVDHGLYVGYDTVAGEWVLSCSSPRWYDAMVRAICSDPVGTPVPVGFSPVSTAPGDRLFTCSSGQLVDITAAAGIPASLHGRSVVAADFDNDMDLDLYVVTTTEGHNTDNVLLANQGNGVFVPVPAGPAAGSAEGVGDSVATLDYDCDGRIDLFLVNGGGIAFGPSGSPGAFADDGPAQLLRNVTPTTNHWLQVELVGTASNRDGIGARIEVVAGGITQVREHGGGMHRYSQNHGIHFGLGPNQLAATVIVRWPSGLVSVRQNVAADQRLQVVE